MPKRRSSKRRSGKGGSRIDRWLIAGIGLVLIGIIIVLWGPGRKAREGEERKPPVVRKAAPQRKQDQPRTQEPKQQKAPEVAASRPQAAKEPRERALVAIIIDDLGGDLRAAREIASLPGSVTFSVLPGLAHSRDVALFAAEQKREIILHMPMERKNNRDKPETTGTLRSDMTPAEFVATIERNIGSVPGAVIVNNHEGSALTENREAMKFLMMKLKERDLAFLDSLTSPKSVAAETAREFGLRTAKRDVFLDNDGENADAILAQLAELEQKARARGHAIGIGHPHPATISALRQWMPEAKKRGIEIVPVTRLLK